MVGTLFFVLFWSVAVAETSQRLSPVQQKNLVSQSHDYYRWRQEVKRQQYTYRHEQNHHDRHVGEHSLRTDNIRYLTSNELPISVHRGRYDVWERYRDRKYKV